MLFIRPGEDDDDASVDEDSVANVPLDTAASAVSEVTVTILLFVSVNSILYGNRVGIEIMRREPTHQLKRRY